MAFLIFLCSVFLLTLEMFSQMYVHLDILSLATSATNFFKLKNFAFFFLRFFAFQCMKVP